MRTKVALIGGTGIGDALLADGAKAIHLPTSAGLFKGHMIKKGDQEIVVLRRHAAGHKVPPHAVNYRAMALGLKALGIKHCISTGAVGSLKADWGPGTMAVCSDFIDFTGRNITLFDKKVQHTDFTSPFSAEVNLALVQSAGRDMVRENAVYVCTNGPRYETPHEIRLLANVGDVIGMTVASEAIVMREAGIEYGCLAIVTNLAAGLAKGELKHDDVSQRMGTYSRSALAILLGAATELGNG